MTIEEFNQGYAKPGAPADPNSPAPAAPAAPAFTPPTTIEDFNKTYGAMKAAAPAAPEAQPTAETPFFSELPGLRPATPEEGTQPETERYGTQKEGTYRIVTPKVTVKGWTSPAGAAFNAVSTATEGFTNRLIDLYDFAVNQGVMNREGGIDKTAAETFLAKVIRFGGATAGLAFSPISAELGAAKQLPGVKYPAQFMDYVLGKVGEAGGWIGGKTIDTLPISQQSKDILREPFQELGANVLPLIFGKAIEAGAEGKLGTGPSTITKVGENADGGYTSMLSRGQSGFDAVIQKGAQAAQLAMAPISSSARALTENIQAKIADRQKRGIDVNNPEEAKKIVNEAVKETPIQMPGTMTIHPVDGNGNVIQKGAPDSSDPAGATMQAIGQRESTGNYSALGKTTKSGDRAYGKYQVMGNNIPEWSKEILGRSVTKEQFLKDPALQDKIVRGKIDQLWAKYGNAQDVASVWFTGQPYSEASKGSKDVNGTTNMDYVDSVVKLANAKSDGSSPSGIGSGENAAEPIRVYTDQKLVLQNFIRGNEDLNYQVVSNLGRDTSGNPIGARFEWDYKNQEGTIYVTKASTGEQLAHELGHYFDRALSSEIGQKLSDIIPNYAENKTLVDSSLAAYAVDSLGGNATKKAIAAEVKSLAGNFKEQVLKLGAAEPRGFGEKFAEAVRQVLNHPDEARKKAPDFSKFVEYSLKQKGDDGIIAKKIQTIAKNQEFRATRSGKTKAKFIESSESLQAKFGDKNLSPQYKEIERKAFEQIEKNPKAAVDQYIKKFGKVVNTDQARELFPDYEKDRSLSGAVHEPASYLTKLVFERLLVENKGKGNNIVIFTGGGTGAGKSEAIESNPAVKEEVKNASIVYDSNLNNLKSAEAKIGMAKKAGYDAKIYFVIRDPVDALVNGALPRAEKTGRTVPIEEHVATHAGARDSALALAEKFARDSKLAAEVLVIDNTRGKHNAALVESPIDFLRERVYSEGELATLHSRTKEILDQQYERQKISQKTYEGTRYGKGLPADVRAGQEDRGSNGQQSEPQRGGERNGNPAIPAIGTERLAERATQLTAKNGGVTISLKGDIPTEGFALSENKQTERVIPKQEFKQEAVEKYIDDNFEALQQENAHLGIWVDEGKIYMDVSSVYSERSQAIEAAAKADQLAVFDLKNFESIYTKDEIQNTDQEAPAGNDETPQRGNAAAVQKEGNAAAPRKESAPSGEAPDKPGKFKGKRITADAFNADKVNAPERVIDILNDIADSNDNFASQRRATTLQEMKNFALKYLGDESLYKDVPADIRKNIGRMKAAEQTMVDLASELQTKLQETDMATASQAEMDEITAQFKALEKVTASFSGARTEASHLFASLKSEVSPGENQIMRELFTEMKNLGLDTTDMDKFFKDTAEVKKKVLNETRGEAVMATWYSFLLSGPTTFIKNAVSTAGSVAGEVLSAGIRNPREAMEAFPNLMHGLVDGLGMAKEVALGNRPGAAEAAKFSRTEKIPYEFKGPAAIFNKMRLVGRLLAASDTVFNEGLRQMELGALNANMPSEVELLKLGAQKAKAEGFKGADIEVKAREYAKDPETLLGDLASKFALRGTFNSDPEGILGTVSRAVSHATREKPALKFLAPFTRVVANVVNRSVDYTPYGYTRIMSGEGLIGGKLSETFGGKAKETWSRREMMQQTARATVGTVALAYAFYLATKDKLSGDGPRNFSRKQQLLDEGWRPNSIKIGDTWIPYQNAGPLALPLAIAANSYESTKYGEIKGTDWETRTAAAVSGSLSTIFSMSFLSGINNFMDVVKSDDPKKLQKFIGSTASGIIEPNLLKQVGRLFDPTIYQTNSVMEKVLSDMRITGGLKPQLTVFGEEVEGDRLTQLSPSTETSDPVIKYLADNQLWVPIPAKNTEVKLGPKEKRPMTSDEYYEYVKLSGPEIKKQIEKKLPLIERQSTKDKQQKIINDVVDSVRSRVRGQITLEAKRNKNQEQ